MRSPAASGRADAWRCGSTAATLRRRNGSTAASAPSPHACPRASSSPCAPAWARLGSIPVLNRTLNKIANFSSHPDWTLRVCDNFDWYAPRYQSHHSLDELKHWFADEGFTDIVELRPAKNGNLYNWAYDHNLIIGSGVNVAGRK